MRTFLTINGAPVLGFGGWLCIPAAALHILCIWGGGAWYRALGAGEMLARAAERGSIMPHLLAGGIACALMIAATYAIAAATLVSGRGIQTRLPSMGLVLSTICVVLLVRGLLIFVPGVWRPDLAGDYRHYSSMIVLVMAAVFIFGTWQAWPYVGSIAATSKRSSEGDIAA